MTQRLQAATFGGFVRAGRRRRKARRGGRVAQPQPPASSRGDLGTCGREEGGKERRREGGRRGGAAAAPRPFSPRLPACAPPSPADAIGVRKRRQQQPRRCPREDRAALSPQQQPRESRTGGRQPAPPRSRSTRPGCQHAQGKRSPNPLVHPSGGCGAAEGLCLGRQGKR